ncbi:hypothetical protein ACPYPG_33450 [Streptomyces sp. FR-108]|uniref:hypothetical protein n=1 Tax=Streptomyces sp. FR-108 TaxID=3416665 RepID=UPI003CF1EA63
MLQADHPNALWLAGLYGGDGGDDGTGDKGRRAARALRSISPEFVVHTGGIRLAATGDLDFMKGYEQRRSALGRPALVELYQILADDHFAIVYARYRFEQGGAAWEGPGMGAWRFEDGRAVEHWELPDGKAWDAFYLAADPGTPGERAADYWAKSPV